ncbi:ABC transporter substrate-binding protein [Ochrobactrum sp. Q0168]|uniref:ABC transporter substrate-binding protein n=1 Tax=Ochrobactrum sp. Q0168 TaxID=2793241 RepID=UPI0018EA720A|nr:ABC transporter substrate-binding protein [Ochrobactrum sp. Q0168]
MKKIIPLGIAALLSTLAAIPNAFADVKIGVVLALSGSAASQGIPENQGLQLGLPKEIGGQKIELIVLDDAGDPAIATRNVQKLINDEKVDIIVGPTTTPSAIAMSQVAAGAQVPIIPLAPVSLNDSRDQWLFNVPPPPVKWIIPVVNDMKKRGVKTVGFLGFSDAWGDVSKKALETYADKMGYQIVADERFARADTSVTGQVLKLMAANPDAIFLGVSGTPGVLPNVTLKDQGYPGPIYNGNGIMNKDFLKLGGTSIEGIYGAVGAIGVGDQLPDSEPRKPVVAEFVKSYDAKYGAGKADALSGYGYDTGIVLSIAIEKALAKDKPGTHEFRAALRDGMRELNRVPGVHSIYAFSDPSWPWGVGDDAAFLVTVKDGKWMLIQ